MKIRNSFVANSSSTSFLIISRGEITRAALFELVGVDGSSPWFPFFDGLFNAVSRRMMPVEEYVSRGRHSKSDWLGELSMDFPEEVVAKVVAGQEEGKTVFAGRLSSDDGDLIEAFFAVDSFEIDNGETYFNALECAW